MTYLSILYAEILIPVGKNSGNGTGKKTASGWRNESGTIDVRSSVIILAAIITLNYCLELNLRRISRSKSSIYEMELLLIGDRPGT